jgi:hypothetical protein
MEHNAREIPIDYWKISHTHTDIFAPNFKLFLPTDWVKDKKLAHFGIYFPIHSFVWTLRLKLVMQETGLHSSFHPQTTVQRPNVAITNTLYLIIGQQLLFGLHSPHPQYPISTIMLQIGTFQFKASLYPEFFYDQRAGECWICSKITVI